MASVARLLELDDLLAREVATLSGGERQRVALGRAICSGPTLLLLDEPLASLDLPLRRKLLPFLRRTRDTFGIPMIFVSHDPLEVQAICDDLIVLQDGAAVARGAPRDVLTDPEIFPLAEREGYENILPCQTIDSRAGTCRVRLGESSSENAAAGPELVALTGQDRPGEVRLVGIPAHEIMIATHEPVGLTARNVLRARVVEVRAVGSLALVIVDLERGGGAQLPHLTVEVTETASTDLGLSPGKDVYVVIKAASCRLYG